MPRGARGRCRARGAREGGVPPTARRAARPLSSRAGARPFQGAWKVGLGCRSRAPSFAARRGPATSGRVEGRPRRRGRLPATAAAAVRADVQ
eukprot:508275-Lingulodinium_polyedra.AAC.1